MVMFWCLNVKLRHHREMVFIFQNNYIRDIQLMSHFCDLLFDLYQKRPSFG